MIPAPDFRIDIAINISEEVIRMGCATIGFALAMLAVVKITQLLFGKSTQEKQE